MSLRFLLGILPSGLPEENNKTTKEEFNTSLDAGVENYTNIVLHYENPAKFHIGMLTLSLLVGIAYSGYTAYTCWKEKNTFLGYVRNLVIALTCRTFFSIIFDGAVLLGSHYDVGGGNFLLSIEHICLNSVIAFWLTLNIYLHERMQSNFSNEPTLLMYQLGVPGVAVFFAFVWIFTLQDQWPNTVWWIFVHPFTQWIVNSVNLLYLLIQLLLLGNITMKMTKITLDNDGLSLQMKCSAMMGVLVFIFWLHFGLSIGRVPLKTTESYLYFYYLIDGLECGLICLVLFFFYKWVLLWYDKLTSMLFLSTRTSESNQAALTTGQGIVTLDSMFMTPESGRWKTTEAAEEGEERSKDVVYSNVIGPERLRKTLDLYKRLNIIPTNQVTTVEGEEFYDCQLQNQIENFDKRFESLKPNVPTIVTDESCFKLSETKQKKNAFYSSKYLILDSKESEMPKYLETQPSVSSFSGKGSFRDGRSGKSSPLDLNLSMTDELVRKWLDDVMVNKTAQSKRIEERKPETPKTELREDENDTPKTIFSAINSVVSNVLFGSKTNENKSIDKDVAKPLEIHKTEPEKKSDMDIGKLLPGETAKPQEALLREASEPQVDKNKPVDMKTNEIELPNFKAEHPKMEEKALIETTSPRKDEKETAKPQDVQLEEVLEPQVDIKLSNKEEKEPTSPRKDAQFEQVLEPQEDIKAQLPKKEQKSSVEITLQRKDEKETAKPQDVQLKQVLQPQEDIKAQLPKKEEKPPVEITSESRKDETKTTPGKEENSAPLSTHIESHPKDQMELKTYETQHPPLEPKPRDEEDKTPGESADEFKHKPELAVLDKSDSLSLSLSHIITPTSKKEEESQSEKPPNQNITYSDLLEFRSQRDKSTAIESSGISKKLFDFSESLTSTIGSLINGSFFTTRKQHSENESVVSETERKNLENTQDEKFRTELTEKPPTILPELKKSSESSSESEFSIERKKDSSSSAESFSVDQYYLQLLKTKEKFYNQPNSIYQTHKTRRSNVR